MKYNSVSAMMAMDHRLKELLLLVLIDVLRREDDADVVNINGDATDESAISKELLIIAKGLIDAQLLDTLGADDGLLGLGANDGKVMDKSSPTASSNQLLMDDYDAFSNNKRMAAAKKKKRNRRKAAVKQKLAKLVSWLGDAGLIPKMVMMAFSSITMLIAALSLIHQSDGSGEGNLPPALQPTTSKSLLRRGQSDEPSSNEAVTSPEINIISSPLAAVTPPPVLSSAAVRVSNRHLKSGGRDLSTCVDTPSWKDGIGDGCDWYEENDSQGCPLYSTRDAGSMGLATENCCYCGGGIHTCEDYRSICQKHFGFVGIKDDALTTICKEAASCSCEDGDDEFNIIEGNSSKATVGLYNSCKCDFWSDLCEDSVGGLACDHAAEYCCGDYSVSVGDNGGGKDTFHTDSATCYCDFFNYAKNRFGQPLRPPTAVAMNITKEMPSPCEMLAERVADPDYQSDELESLTAIYMETNGPHWTNNAGWMDDYVPICSWYGITCNSGGRVTSIDLRDNNLVGQFPSGDKSSNKYGLSTLYVLKTLDLAYNKLVGTIDYLPLYNLYLLTHFDVSGNQLSGEVNALVTPSISYVNFNNNRFTSMRRFEPYKVSSAKTIRSIDVSNNNISIDAANLLQNMPPNVGQFLASKNDMHGNLPASLNHLPNLRQFDVSFNALSGKLPLFGDSIMTLQELNLSNQKKGFTGTIPNEIKRAQFLKILNLAGNKLTGTMSSDVANFAVLQEINLSGNRLSGRIPSEVGKLGGTLKHLDLADNTLSGVIPSQVGLLQGAFVFLKGNRFATNISAPLSLCTLNRVKYSDIAENVTFCPIERNALSGFYNAAKGVEWTNDTNWNDEYLSHCEWHGVTCVNNQVRELRLTNDGLSGRLSESIGNLTSLEVLDLSDNDIKGPIPTEIGLLSKLRYLRLSYNAFTGEAPDGLRDLRYLKLLQLQSNWITGIPNISRLGDDIYKDSAFVTDCGVPSAFDAALECENCTMCCNANEDCYPQKQKQVEKWGLGYGTFAAVLWACFTAFCCIVVLFLYRFRKNIGNTSSLMSNVSLEESDQYALSKIGKDSVYSYFVTDKCFGWIVAFVILGAQAFILVIFVFASEANLQNDKIDLQFTWKCPRDTDVCSDTSDLNAVGWAMFSILMIAFLAKDIINGSKLIYHSSRTSYPLWSRIRYFIGGWSLCSITLYALYVSTVYNHAIAASNTDIILNSVVVLFVMDMDETIFAALEASNVKWTAHSSDSDDDTSSDAKEERGDSTTTAIEKMKKKIASQEAKIQSQQEELTLQKKQMARQSNEIANLWKAVQKVHQPQAVTAVWSEAIPQRAATLTASESVSWDLAEDPRSDPVAGREDVMNAMNENKDENMFQEEYRGGGRFSNHLEVMQLQPKDLGHGVKGTYCEKG